MIIVEFIWELIQERFGLFSYNQGKLDYTKFAHLFFDRRVVAFFFDKPYYVFTTRLQWDEDISNRRIQFTIKKDTGICNLN